jgi:hypothetical protein
MEILKDITKATAGEKTEDGKAFHETVKDIQKLTDQLETIANKVFQSNRADLLIKLFKLIV